MKAVKLLFFATLATMMLGCCDNKNYSEYQLEYLAVQMSKGDNWSIVDKDGKEVAKGVYPADASISRIKDSVYWVKLNGKYRLFSLDDPKNPVIDEEFSGVTLFSGGVSAVSAPNKPIRIINTSGITMATLPENVKECHTFSTNGYARYLDTNNKEGLLDSNGNIVINAEYSTFFGKENEGLLLAQREEEDRFILILDTCGQKLGEIDTEEYNLEATHFSEGKLLVSYVDEYDDTPLVVLDKKGNKLFDIMDADASCWFYYYTGGYLVFSNIEEKWGVANDKGRVVILPKYDDYIFNLGDGLFLTEKKGKLGVIDANDKTIIDFKYEDGAYFRLGDNFLMFDGRKWSLMRRGGKEIAHFDNIDSSYCDSYVSNAESGEAASQ